VLVVTNGTLTLRSGSGCNLQEYVAGQAVVVPAGLHRLSNAGDQPLALSGALLDASANGPTPFIGGIEAAPPAGCGRLAAHGLGTAPSPGSVVRSSRGIVVGADAYRHSDHAHYASDIDAEPGTDILVTSIRVEPHSSSGWMRHKPTIGIITKGTLTYYEGHDGRCVKTGEFSAGQAYVHASPVTHMATNEGPETFEAIYVYFNLPHNSQPLPVISNLTDSIDFAPLPPKDCPRLR
jgi:quercetin dioxygenase-like cupin family protein